MPLVTAILEAVFFPPGGVVVVLVVAGWWIPRRPRLALGLIWAALLLLYASSLEWTTEAVGIPLHHYPPLSDEVLREGQAGAIVILGMGRYLQAPEYGYRDTLNAGGTMRARYGARLHRLSGLPILVSGGRPFQEVESEAELMRQVLTGEWGVKVRWVEDQSRNTWENALFSKAILAREGIERVILVTHGRDMSRAVWSFEQVGLAVTPAPTLIKGKSPVDQGRWVLRWLPNAGVLAANHTLFHEVVGGWWYRLRHW